MCGRGPSSTASKPRRITGWLSRSSISHSLREPAERALVLDQMRAHHLRDDDRVQVAIEREVGVVPASRRPGASARCGRVRSRPPPRAPSSWRAGSSAGRRSSGSSACPRTGLGVARVRVAGACAARSCSTRGIAPGHRHACWCSTSSCSDFRCRASCRSCAAVRLRVTPSRGGLPLREPSRLPPREPSRALSRSSSSSSSATSSTSIVITLAVGVVGHRRGDEGAHGSEREQGKQCAHAAITRIRSNVVAPGILNSPFRVDGRHRADRSCCLTASIPRGPETGLRTT